MQEKSKVDCEETEGETWADDQREHSYYYDDAHGYEEYKDEDDLAETQSRSVKNSTENES